MIGFCRRTQTIHNQPSGRKKMAWFARMAVAALLAAGPGMVMAGPAEEGAAAIDRWVAAYNANDLDALVKVYAPDAILQGTSEPQINVGTADLRKYFRNLPKGGSSNSIQERRMFVIMTPPRWASGSTPSKAASGGSHFWSSSSETNG
jgi:hypothetical protein